MSVEANVFNVNVHLFWKGIRVDFLYFLDVIVSGRSWVKKW